MNDNTLCPLCGEGAVSLRTDHVESDYMGSKALVDLHYAECSACKSDFAGAEQSLLNKRAVMAFRKSADGLPLGSGN